MERVLCSTFFVFDYVDSVTIDAHGQVSFPASNVYDCASVPYCVQRTQATLTPYDYALGNPPAICSQSQHFLACYSFPADSSQTAVGFQGRSLRPLRRSSPVAIPIGRAMGSATCH